MITRDLKLYLLLACIPAFALTAMALVQLCRLTAAWERDAREKTVKKVLEQAKRSVFAGQEGQSLNSLEMRCAQFRADMEAEFGQVPVIGAFVWRARDGIVCTNGVPSAVLREIDGIGSLGAWSADPRLKKKPPNADARSLAGHYVVWARDARRNGFLCGVVFRRKPKVAGLALVATWPIGVALGMMLVIVFGAGAWLLARAAAKARRDDLMKTTFLSNASHELKTPLAGIGLWTELLRGGRLDTEERRSHAYDVIAAENARMIRLVENLLDFSRLEQGRRRYRMECVDLVEIARESVDVVRGDFERHGIQMRGCSEPCMAIADADAVKQILINLLGNAAKYAADDGPVEVEVHSDGSSVFVAVADCGPGIPADAMAHVFERFWRADSALSAEKGGLGLGLAISRAMAEDMDGDLSVASRSGGGCVFTLVLPACNDC